ncbi:winged helix-turn-helix transcriptional regulator [Frigidibacter sp. MR17.24]|uniref:winged helix-turn-helix transcriptional regulator n=1 Tax=Frigidibacter sp. MR17.24 TaxID=3127345 RepID=UPI0030130FE4
MKYERDTEAAKPRRSYGDGCGMAQALDVIGERWALLVVRELMFHPRRFSELRADLPGIAPTVLTQRLAELERAGVVCRDGRLYGLSDWGRGLEPALQALGVWAVAGPAMRFDLPISVATLVMSLRTLFSPARAGTLELSLGLDFGAGQTFAARVSAGRLTIGPGLPEGAVRVTGDRMALAAVIHGGAPIEGSGLAIAGDPAVLQAFAGLFPLR